MQKEEKKEFARIMQWIVLVLAETHNLNCYIQFWIGIPVMNLFPIFVCKAQGTKKENG